MPDYRSMYDDKWLKAWDLQGKTVTVIIERVEAGLVENKDKPKGERKPVIHFKGKGKPLALNKTNGATIAQMYGKDTTAWVGKPITIYGTTTKFGRDTVDCIRVKPGTPTGPAQDMPEPPPTPKETRCDSGTCGQCDWCKDANR